MKIKHILTLMIGIFIPSFAFAGPVMSRVKNVAKESYNTVNTNANSISSFVGTIVNVILGFLGVLFVMLIIYAGFTWMTSSGDKEKVAKATKIIGASVVGLLIVIASYAVWNFILIRIIL